MSGPDIAAFITARLVETENGNREIHEARICSGCSDGWEAGFNPDRCDCGYPARVLRETAALRAVLVIADEATDIEFQRDQEFARFDEYPEVSIGDRMKRHVAVI